MNLFCWCYFFALLCLCGIVNTLESGKMWISVSSVAVYLCNLLILFICYLYFCVASFEVRQLYKQFIPAVVELMGGEVVSEEFQEVALTVYRLFSGTSESEEDEREKRVLSKKLVLLFLFFMGSKILLVEALIE